jgi:hypothetical protein
MDPFDCPVCLQRFDDKEFVPVTLPCGHSCCLAHMAMMSQCFHCRAALPTLTSLNPNYALRDGAIQYSCLVSWHQNMIEERRHRSWWSSGSLFSCSGAAYDAVVSRSKISNRQSNHGQGGVQNQQGQLDPHVPTSSMQALQHTSAATGVTDSARKRCGHHCGFSALNMCCCCMDRRPIIPEGTYPMFVEGIGFTFSAMRNAGYCLVCKLHAARPPRENQSFVRLRSLSESIEDHKLKTSPTVDSSSQQPVA